MYSFEECILKTFTKCKMYMLFHSAISLGNYPRDILPYMGKDIYWSIALCVCVCVCVCVREREREREKEKEEKEGKLPKFP